jgi:hypothetical protein
LDDVLSRRHKLAPGLPERQSNQPDEAGLGFGDDDLLAVVQSAQVNTKRPLVVALQEEE